MSFGLWFTRNRSIRWTQTLSTEPAGPVTISSASRLVQNGCLVAEVAFVPSTNIVDQGDFYVFEASTTDGVLAVRHTDSDGLYRLIVRGVEVLTTTGGSYPGANMTARAGDEVRIRAWYVPRTGLCGLRVWVNGCAGRDATTTATSSLLAAPTALKIGSKIDGTQAIAGQMRHVRSFAPSQGGVKFPAEIVILGDSTIAGDLFSMGHISVGSGIYSLDQARDRSYGIASLAASGDAISAQRAKWDASGYAGDSNVQAVIIQCGINDIAGLISAATIITSLNNWIADIADTNPDASIYISKINPIRNALSAPQQAIYDAVQLAIEGGGATPVTGVDGRITEHYTVLSNSDSMRTAYQISGVSDNVHENDAGRAAIAAAYQRTLANDAILPTWTPDVISDCAGWWRASNYSTGSWPNLISGRVTATQGTVGIQPTAATGINSRASVSFDGGDFLSASGVGITNNNFTMLAVQKFNAIAAGCSLAIGSDLLGGLIYSINFAATSKRELFVKNAAVLEDGNATTDPECWITSRDSTTLKMVVNGFNQTITSPTTAVSSPGDVIIFGAGSDAGFSPFAGHLGDVIFWTRQLTTGEIAQANAHEIIHYALLA